MSQAIPIACSLNNRQLQERRQTVLRELAASLIDVAELPDGFRYRFPCEDSLLKNLINVISLERKCCPFLNFQLNFESGKDFVSLDLTGESGAKEAIRELFSRN